MDGVPVGRELGRYLMQGETGDGSLMMVVATDAPLDARQLRRLAPRAPCSGWRAPARLPRTAAAIT